MCSGVEYSGVELDSTPRMFWHVVKQWTAGSVQYVRDD